MFCLLSLCNMLYLLAGEGVGAVNSRAVPGGTHSTPLIEVCLEYVLLYALSFVIV